MENEGRGVNVNVAVLCREDGLNIRPFIGHLFPLPPTDIHEYETEQHARGAQHVPEITLNAEIAQIKSATNAIGIVNTNPTDATVADVRMTARAQG